MSSALKAAIAYAERLGFACFPVGPDCRVPWTGEGRDEGRGGCHAATADPTALTAMWNGAPNVAVACGPASGVMVLDVDVKGADNGFASLAALEARFGPLPPSWRTSTPSGGAHLWFRHPQGQTVRNKVGLRMYEDDGKLTVWRGLDIRTRGGSVALPPSRKPTGAYTWEVSPNDAPLADPPAWLVDLAKDQPPPERKPFALAGLRRHLANPAARDRIARYVEVAIDREAAAVASTPKNGGRNARLFSAACNLGELIGSGYLPQDLAQSALEHAAFACGLTQEDGRHSVIATINSGFRKGVANPREIAA